METNLETKGWLDIWAVSLMSKEEFKIYLEQTIIRDTYAKKLDILDTILSWAVNKN